MGIGSSVDMAGAPVSPRISAPSPLDFRRGRVMPFFDLELLLCLLYFWFDSSGNVSIVRDIMQSRWASDDPGDIEHINCAESLVACQPMPLGTDPNCEARHHVILVLKALL